LLERIDRLIHRARRVVLHQERHRVHHGNADSAMLASRPDRLVQRRIRRAPAVSTTGSNLTRMPPCLRAQRVRPKCPSQRTPEQARAGYDLATNVRLGRLSSTSWRRTAIVIVRGCERVGRRAADGLEYRCERKPNAWIVGGVWRQRFCEDPRPSTNAFRRRVVGRSMTPGAPSIDTPAACL
jgi:hypothetical protein